MFKKAKNDNYSKENFNVGLINLNNEDALDLVFKEFNEDIQGIFILSIRYLNIIKDTFKALGKLNAIDNIKKQLQTFLIDNLQDIPHAYGLIASYKEDKFLVFLLKKEDVKNYDIDTIKDLFDETKEKLNDYKLEESFTSEPLILSLSCYYEKKPDFNSLMNFLDHIDSNMGEMRKISKSKRVKKEWKNNNYSEDSEEEEVLLMTANIVKYNNLISYKEKEKKNENYKTGKKSKFITEKIVHKNYSLEEWENLSEDKRNELKLKDKNKAVWKVYHCHGADRGKPITKEWVTYDKALKQHKAIMVNKK